MSDQESASEGSPQPQLKRALGPWGAVMTGLGSMLGTGVFVALGLAAGVSGLNIGWAILLACFVASWNGLSSAQLAAVTPVSGGTYEYGYRYLGPAWGRAAGWLFLIAKTASAAAAALACAGYFFALLGIDLPRPIIAIVGVVVVGTAGYLIDKGVRRSTFANTILVGMTVAAIVAFIVFVWPAAFAAMRENVAPFYQGPKDTGAFDLLRAAALVFVAFTGYGRIATLGEEVVEPRETIPWAITRTITISAFLYLGVGITACGVAGAAHYYELAVATASPLVEIARTHVGGGLALLVAIGGVTATAATLLNLLLGTSRVALAMGRRHDLPKRLATIAPSGESPQSAVLFVTVVTALVCLLGSVRFAWSLSAGSVLAYYAITNAAALRIPEKDRFVSQLNSKLGLVGCVVLAAAVEPWAWIPIAGVFVAVKWLYPADASRSEAKGKPAGK